MKPLIYVLYKDVSQPHTGDTKRDTARGILGGVLLGSLAAAALLTGSVDSPASAAADCGDAKGDTFTGFLSYDQNGGKPTMSGFEGASANIRIEQGELCSGWDAKGNSASNWTMMAETAPGSQPRTSTPMRTGGYPDTSSSAWIMETLSESHGYYTDIPGDDSGSAVVWSNLQTQDAGNDSYGDISCKMSASVVSSPRYGLNYPSNKGCGSWSTYTK